MTLTSVDFDRERRVLRLKADRIIERRVAQHRQTPSSPPPASLTPTCVEIAALSQQEREQVVLPAVYGHQYARLVTRDAQTESPLSKTQASARESSIRQV